MEEYKNLCFSGVPLTELINENALSLAPNCSIVPFKSILTVCTVGVPGLILCIAKLA